MSRCVINVSAGADFSGRPYSRGQLRLRSMFSGETLMMWSDEMPQGCPSHREVPYAFKGFALKAAADAGHTLLLWADCSIVPVGSLEPLWEKIAIDGYWISKNGWTNYEWTASSAYEYLGISPAENRQVPHVVATAFGLNLEHEKGYAIFEQYTYLAKTRAFCGPWTNGPRITHPRMADRQYPCGPDDVRGHRHDQTALSVVAWRNHCVLTDPPAWFAYRGGETAETVLVADGTY